MNDRCTHEVSDAERVRLREEVSRSGSSPRCRPVRRRTDGDFADRRWTAAVGHGDGRGEQEFRAAADCGLPPQGRGMYHHATCRGSATSKCCCRSSGDWARRSRELARRRCGWRCGSSPPSGPIRCSWGSCAARCCCSGRCWRGAAPPGWRLPAEIFRRGARISTHLQALVALGAVPVDEPGHALDAPNGLTGASFYLDEASVTGTETALLAAAAARGRTEIRHAAMEPHVGELCLFLRAMGVGNRRHRHTDDSGRGAGPVQRRDTSSPGRLCRGGQLGRRRRHHRRSDHHHRCPGRGHGSDCRSVSADGSGSVSYEGRSVLGVAVDADRDPPDHHRPLAGFPSDMVSLVTVLATQADGRTLVHDWLYELRLSRSSS